MPLEDFGKYFNNKNIQKDDAQELMNEMIEKKRNDVENKQALYAEFDKLKLSIDALDAEIDALIPQQNKAHVPMLIAKKHENLTQYQRKLQELQEQYPSIAQMKDKRFEEIMNWLKEKSKLLTNLQNTSEDFTQSDN